MIYYDLKQSEIFYNRCLDLMIKYSEAYDCTTKPLDIKDKEFMGIYKTLSKGGGVKFLHPNYQGWVITCFRKSTVYHSNLQFLTDYLHCQDKLNGGEYEEWFY